MHLRTLAFSLIGLCSAAAASVGFYLAALQWSGNFHEVIPGAYYRSAQLGGPALDAAIRRYGLKTVINLRGAKPGKKWYDDEIAAVKRNGAGHIDFAMSATRQLDAAQMEKLTALLRDAPQPILVHCRAGSDRTGLASVIFLQQVRGVEEDEAEHQLSLAFGHVGLPFLGAFAMERSWEAMERTLGLDS